MDNLWPSALATTALCLVLHELLLLLLLLSEESSPELLPLSLVLLLELLPGLLVFRTLALSFALAFACALVLACNGAGFALTFPARLADGPAVDELIGVSFECTVRGLTAGASGVALPEATATAIAVGSRRFLATLASFWASFLSPLHRLSSLSHSRAHILFSVPL